MLTGCLAQKHYSRMGEATRSNRNIESFAVVVFWWRCECRADCSPAFNESTAASEGSGAGETHQSLHVMRKIPHTSFVSGHLTLRRSSLTVLALHTTAGMEVRIGNGW